jgi:erythromycin esterase-like protein
VLNRKSAIILALGLYTFLKPTSAYATDLDHWVSENAIHLEQLDPSLSYPQLAALDKAVQGKRIVFLGEAAHWVHEKYDYRLIMLKRLIALGYTNVGMEMGISDGQRVDDFLRSGRSADLDRVALYGYLSPYIRSRTIPGMCPDSIHGYPQLGSLFKGEESWFFTQLRQLGASLAPAGDRVHYFGYDLDMAVGGGYEDIEKILNAHLEDAAIAEISKLLHPPAGDSTTEEIKRLTNALTKIAAQQQTLSDKLGSSGFKSVRLATQALLASVEFLQTYQSRPCDISKVQDWNKELLLAMAARERMMFEIMRAKLEALGPQAKIVLMGHDFHLSKNPESLRFTNAEVPDPFAPPMWPSIGQYVSQTLAIPTYSIWMIQSKGSQSNIDCALAECPIATGSNYIGSLLKMAAPFSLVPLNHSSDSRAKSLDQRLSFSVNGGTHSGNILENADAIFYVETVSGLKQRTP